MSNQMATKQSKQAPQPVQPMRNAEQSYLSVFDLNTMIKGTLDPTFKKIQVEGELSNIKISGSNIYCTLKDDKSMINMVIWNYQTVLKNIKLENGKKIKVAGTLSTFIKSGTYNVNAYIVETVGTGDLHTEYIKLKGHFESIGYFDQSSKKPLPIHIETIGIATSVNGAALQDFLYVLTKNNFVGTVYVANCAVQGHDCPLSVANAIYKLNSLDNVDVIVIMRGGGAFEDLYGFSHQDVIETIWQTDTCTISAIGHEIDFMLSDFVADIRAPTPSIAGEIVSQHNKYQIIMNNIDNLINHANQVYKAKVGSLISELDVVKYKIESNGNSYDRIMYQISNIENQVASTFKSRVMAQSHVLNDIEYKIKSSSLAFDKIINNIDSIRSQVIMAINTKLSKWMNQIDNIGNTLMNANKRSGQVQILSHDQQTLILTYDDFVKHTDIKKKLVIQFGDQVVEFNIRSIKKL